HVAQRHLVPESEMAQVVCGIGLNGVQLAREIDQQRGARRSIGDTTSDRRAKSIGCRLVADRDRWRIRCERRHRSRSLDRKANRIERDGVRTRCEAITQQRTAWLRDDSYGLASGGTNITTPG